MMKNTCGLLLIFLFSAAGMAHAVDAGYIGAADDYLSDLIVHEGDGVVSIPINPADNDGYIEKSTNGTEIINISFMCNLEPVSTTIWDNKGLIQNDYIDWTFNGGVTYSDVTSAHAGIKGAYFFDGVSGFTSVGYDSSHDSYSELVGTSLDHYSATFEMWVKLHEDDLSHFVTLFECGGGTGTGIAVENGVLTVANDLGEAKVTYDLLTDPSGLHLLVDHCTNEFFQLVFVMDFENDLNSLYVNGQLVGTAANTNSDWDGGDGTSIGHFTGTNHGGFKNTAAGSPYDTYYHGAVSIFKIYDGALNADQAMQNYNAIHDNTDVNGSPIAFCQQYRCFH